MTQSTQAPTAEARSAYDLPLASYDPQRQPSHVLPAKMPKIVVIGAGSAIFGLNALATLVRSPRLRGAELALVDINAEALDLMTRLAEVMNREWGAQMKINAYTDRTKALPGADFVVVTIQVGHRETVWRKDWEIPLKHGIRQPYAENSGPGAFAHAARNMPVMLDIAKDMERYCPNALYMNFTNPLIRLTWGVKRYSTVPVVGMCHQLEWGYSMVGALLAEHYGYADEVPADFHVHTDANNVPITFHMSHRAHEHVQIKAAGINHFSWIYDIREKGTGKDMYPLLREKFAQYRKTFEPLTREMFEIFGLMPTAGDSHMCEYLAFTHDPITKPWEKYHLKLQNWDMNLERRAARLQQAQDIVSGKRDVNEVRAAKTEGLPEIIEAMTYNDNLYMEQLNLYNNGKIPNLPADAIVEVPGVVGSSGVHGLNVPPLPYGIAELCRRELALSSLVVDAAVQGDRDLALQALLLDPMMNDIDRARAILADFLESFAEYLPQFHGQWKLNG
ncbi:MAG: alpha-glucosidase/alpha-galactosidase [Anaerolineae bacterium]